MENNELTNKYELMVIVDGKLPQEEKDVIIKEVIDIVNKVEGKVINSKVWEEKRKLTFKIKKIEEGTYYLINFESKKSSLAKIRNDLRLSEKVLRSSIITL